MWFPELYGSTILNHLSVPLTMLQRFKDGWLVGWFPWRHASTTTILKNTFFFSSHFQIVTLYISISSRPQTPDSWVGSPFNQCMSDPTAVPVVLLQLYFKRLPVVTHVFSKETGFAKHKLLTHAQSRFSPSQHRAVITDWMKHPEKGIKKKKNPKGCLELSAASCCSSLNKFTRSQLFIVSPKNH